VRLKQSFSNSTMLYTLDGSDPTLGGASTLTYVKDALIVIPGPSSDEPAGRTTTLKFVEVVDGMMTAVAKEVYTIDTVAPSVILDSPVPGYYHTVQQVSLRASENGTVFYTTDSSGDPATLFDSKKPITVSTDTTFRVKAVDRAGNESEIVTAAYHINIGQTAVGPWNGATGFPTWYSDSNGVQLQLCVDGSGNCLTSVADPSQAPGVPGNFIDEGFFWNATATMNAGVGGKATLVLATEAAFATPDVVSGQQIVFNRIRVKVTNLVPGATYHITHPYGTETATADDGGTIFITEDIGCLDPAAPCIRDTVLGGRLGPWLTWTNLGAAQLDGYVGDGATPHLVTGSPLGTNFFQINGPNAGGQGIDTATTNLFVVAGKLSSTPVINP
jgi:hypothetical protein